MMELHINISPKANISFFIQEPEILDGVALYTQNCQSCHLALNAPSQKLGKKVADIQDAISRNAGGMGYLASLMISELNAIETALAQDYTEPVIEDDSVSIGKFVIGTRRYITSKFTNIFTTTQNNSSDILIKSKINEVIKSNADGFFGGVCSIYDEDCLGTTHRVIFSGSMLPESSSLRRGGVLKTCNMVLGIDQAIQNVLDTAGVNVNSNVSSVNIKKITDIFFPGVTMSSEVLTSLKNIHDKEKQVGGSNISAWKMMMVPICHSSLFETE